MELREYGRILRRFWWLLVALPLAVAVLSLATYRAPDPSYGYTLKLSVSFHPLDRVQTDTDPRLGAVQASEYIADDLTEVLVGTRFAALVQQYLPEGVTMTPDTMADVTRIEKRHRILTVTVSAPTREQAEGIGRAVSQAAQNDAAALLADLWGSGVNIGVIDEEGPQLIPPTIRERLDLPLRVILAGMAAVMLAFLLDYLDDSVRTRKEAEQLLGPVLAEIPKNDGGRWMEDGRVWRLRPPSSVLRHDRSESARRPFG
ncbi:MAG TPA: hypothetical protein VER55_06050 [Ardenticatenaceae bacterium]|nr:hypothetical protein [Ardenticatenaceae bacterium]